MVRMRFVFALLLFWQGVAMGAILIEAETAQHKVPVLFEKSDYVPLVHMRLVFTDAGSLADTKEGIADMAARLLNEGTAKEGSVAFAKSLEDRAINLSAHAGRETFVIELGALKEHFAYGFERLLSLLSDPNYTSEALAHIKNQKIGWLKRKESNYDFIAARELRKLLFPDSPLAKPFEGTVRSITSMKLEEIKSFIATHLGRKNLIVVIGGDINRSEALTYAKKVAVSFPNLSPTRIASVKTSDKALTKRLFKQTQQAYIYFGAPFHFAYNDKEQYKARVMEFVLGAGGFGSRMMEEIRVKRGLAYSAYASLRRTKKTSYLSGYLQTKLTSESEAIEIVKRVIRDFVEQGITQKELDEAKAFLVGSEPLRLESLSQRLHRAFNEYYYERGLGSSIQDLQKIQSLSLEQINKFIKSHPEIVNLSFAIVTKDVNLSK